MLTLSEISLPMSGPLFLVVCVLSGAAGALVLGYLLQCGKMMYMKRIAKKIRKANDRKIKERVDG